MALGRRRIAAGLRDCEVVIEQVTRSVGVSKFPVETWTPLGLSHMSRVDVEADERVVTDQAAAYVRTQWQLEYRADMDPERVDVPKARRLTYKGRVFDILSAMLMERRLGIELITVAKAG